MNRFCSLGLAALLACAAISPVFAGDEGLYPDAPPPGSAFVRFLNTDGSPATALIEGKSYGMAQQGELTRYVPVPHGTAKLAFGGQESTKDVAEGHRYSVLLSKGKMTVLEEPVEKNPLKAQIVVINASSRPGVALKSTDGSVSVVDNVAPGTLGVRAVNAVKVPFALYAEGKKIEEIAARDLERGGSYAVVVYDGAGGKAMVSFNDKSAK